MVHYYFTEGRSLRTLDAPTEGCWISMIRPSESEILNISQKFSIDADDLKSALDTDERSRLAYEDNYTMVLVNIPTIEEDTEKELYDTIPLSIFIAKKTIITVCMEESPILRTFVDGRMRDFNTAMKSRFMMQLLYRTASLYLQYLRNIERQSEVLENNLHKSTQNSALFELLKLEKSLVYFTTSLRSNEVVMEKLFRNERFKKYPEDEELLEDVIIENKQAIEMANIYSGILNGIAGVFASVISNNLNIVMKFLATVTIVLSVPTMIASFFGMNFDNIPLGHAEYGFFTIIVLTLVVSGVVAIFFRKKNLF